MSDKRFKWLLIVASLTCILVAFIWKVPEIIKTSSKIDDRLGQYVYVDSRLVIHASRKCPKLNLKGTKSTRNKVEDLYFYFKSTPIKEITFCPHCVNDRDYEKLIELFSSQMGEEVDRIIQQEKKHE